MGSDEPIYGKKRSQAYSRCRLKDLFHQLLNAIHEHVWWILSEGLGLKSIGAAVDATARIPCRLHVYAAVAHHDRILRRAIAFRNQCLDSDRMRFFLRKTVPAIDPEEV